MLDLKPLFATILEHIPAPVDGSDEPLQLLVNAIDYDEYVGRMATGRIHRGRMTKKMDVTRLGELKAAGVLDGRLSQKPWLLGETYTLADLIVASVIGYSVYLGAPVDQHPITNAWLQKVQARPAMQIDA